VPAGYAAQPDGVLGTGSLDLTKAAASGGVSNARAILGRLGFVHGFERTWQTADQRPITVLLYKFNDPAGAAAYGQQLMSAARSFPGGTITLFGVPEIPGAVGWSRTAGSGTATIVFPKGPYLARLTVSRVVGGDVALVQQLAHAQYARL
jgi:hypothetical protein